MKELTPKQRFNAFMWVVVGIVFTLAVITQTVELMIVVSGALWGLDFIFAGSLDSLENDV